MISVERHQLGDYQRVRHADLFRQPGRHLAGGQPGDSLGELADLRLQLLQVGVDPVDPGGDPGDRAPCLALAHGTS
jgi:hypothetical protein